MRDRVSVYVNDRANDLVFFRLFFLLFLLFFFFIVADVCVLSKTYRKRALIAGCVTLVVHRMLNID